MHPLLKRLASLRMKVRLLDGWQGICAVVALVLGVGVTVGIVDYWVHLPSLARALTLIGMLVGASTVVYCYLVKPFANPCDELTLALRIEEKHPELNDALASTVQFLKQPKDEQARVGGSASMRDRTIKDTLDKLETCDFGSILDRRAAVLYGVAACIILVVAGLVIGMNRQYAAIAALRLLEPFGQHTWTRIAVARSAPGGLIDQPGDNKGWKDIEVGKKDPIAINRPYFIRVSLDGQIPAQAKVEIQGHNKIRSEKTVPLQVNAKEKTATFITSIDMTQQHQKFKFRILANDGAFPPRSNSWHEVEVLPPPKLTKDSPRLTLLPPKYSDLSPQVLPAGTGHLDVFAGTNVVLRASADRPLTEAWLEYRPENALLTPAALVSYIGATSPLHAAGQFAAGQALWGRFPATFEDAERTAFKIDFMPPVTGSYVLHLRDGDQLERHDLFSLNVKKDPLPDVKLSRPAGTVVARPDMIVPFKFRITDETFAVRAVYVEYQRKLGDGTLVGARERIMLYEAKNHGAMIPLWLGQLGLVPRTIAEPRLRKKQLDFETAWHLNNRFKEGEIVVVEVCAEDFCDIHLTREPGRSHAIELRIVSKEQIQRNVAQQLNEIRKKVENVAQMEKKALDTVNEIKKLDKVDQKALDRLQDAELQQKDVQNQVGKTPEQGLRKDLGDLMKQLKDNKLDKTEVAKQAGKIEGALDQIGQNELPQIEPRLVEARNELAQDGKKTPKTEKNLAETSKLQEKVLQGLEELNKELAPFAKMQDLRDNLRDLQQKQENLVKDIENRKADKETNLRDNPDKAAGIEKDFADTMKNKAKEQQEIAQQMEKLVDQFKAAQKERLKEGNKEDAKKLQDAIEKAEPRLQEEKKPKDVPKKQPDNKDPIAAQMRQVADELQKKSDAQQQTLDKANDILDNLDKMAAALEGRNQDTTKQEMQDLQNQQQKMDNLAKKMQQLQNETKKAQQIEDKAERKKEEERLAEKHEELQKEIEKQARELARMQEKRAAAALNDAAKDLDAAKKKLEKGEDAQAQQQEAKDKIDQAKNELREAQDDLARELLIKIADQLKVLGESQRAVLERSESFQGKLLKRKAWSDAFLDTIEGNIDTQKGIAAEADGLKDKIKEAKVFSTILEQAKNSMDKAATVMKERFDEGKDLRKPDPDEKLTPEDLKKEAALHDTTVRHQKQAAQRLDRLLDALKEELEKKKKPQVAQNENPDMNPEEPPMDQPRMRNADGIPGIAELKVLKAEQEDLLARTSEFAKRNPDLKELTEAQRMELNELHMEQDRLRSLFRDVTAPQKEGDLP